MRLIKSLAFIALMALVITGAVMLSGGTMPAAAQNVACYMAQGGARWNAGSGCEWETLQGSVLDLQGDVYLTSATQVVTVGSTIIPTSNYMVLTSSVASTLDATNSITTSASGTTFTVGRLLILRNGNASDAITVDGTGGSVECKANVALGAGDTLILIFDGTDWRCLSGYDNS
jgi:hypothetical protein